MNGRTKGQGHRGRLRRRQRLERTDRQRDRETERQRDRDRETIGLFVLFGSSRKLQMQSQSVALGSLAATRLISLHSCPALPRSPGPFVRPHVAPTRSCRAQRGHRACHDEWREGLFGPSQLWGTIRGGSARRTTSPARAGRAALPAKQAALQQVALISDGVEVTANPLEEAARAGSLHGMVAAGASIPCLSGDVGPALAKSPGEVGP